MRERGKTARCENRKDAAVSESRVIILAVAHLGMALVAVE
jgi:hypothetical protein